MVLEDVSLDLLVQPVECRPSAEERDGHLAGLIFFSGGIGVKACNAICCVVIVVSWYSKVVVFLQCFGGWICSSIEGMVVVSVLRDLVGLQLRR